ncbi:MAG: integrase family protein [Hahellaceae bacterium]|nr:integrase family protein [Hahellaceae bacterium]
MTNQFAFTNRRMTDLPTPDKGRVYYSDFGSPQSVPGLRCAVMSTGVKSFVVVRKLNGKTKFVTLGKFPDISVDTARKLARERIAEVARGVDPNAEKKAERVRGVTLGEVFDDYLKDRKLADNTRGNYRTTLRKYLYDWQNKPLREITRDMVIRRHTDITEGDMNPGPDYRQADMGASAAAANKTMRVLRALFQYADVRYETTPGPVKNFDNPVAGLTALKKWNREGRRDGRIMVSELESWFQAVIGLKVDGDEFDNTAADYLLFLLLTGLRRREASNLKWTDVNMRSRFFTIWKTKNHEPHKLPLPDYLMGVLKARQGRFSSEYVFPGPDLEKPINDPRRQVDLVRRQSGVQFTLHDLRRTFSTVAESLDISHYALKALLNHSGGRDVTGNHYVKIDVERLRKPMETITGYFLKCGGVVVSPSVSVIQAGRG